MMGPRPVNRIVTGLPMPLMAPDVPPAEISCPCEFAEGYSPAEAEAVQEESWEQYRALSRGDRDEYQDYP